MKKKSFWKIFLLIILHAAIIGGAFFYLYSTKWKKFDVTFVLENGEEYTQQVKINHTVVLDDPNTPEQEGLIVPSKQGSIFKGWVLEGTTTAWNYSPVKGSLRLEPTWEAMTTHIRFELNPTEKSSLPSGVSKNASISYGDTINFPIPTRTGYNFDGWKEENGERVYNNYSTWDNTVVTLTLVPTWQLKKTTVTFNFEGAKLTVNDIEYENSKAETYTYGSEYFVLPAPVKEGYSFDGWYLGEDEFLSGSSWAKEDRSITVEAHWTAHVVNVGFELDGGNIGGVTTNPANITCTFDEQIGEFLPNPDKDNCFFDGWYYVLDDEYVKEYTSTTIWDIDYKESTDVVILVAKWVQRTTTITFDANGGKVTDGTGTFDSVKTITVNYKDGLTLPVAATGSTRELLGWFFVDEDGEFGDEWDTNTTSTRKVAVTLKAKWYIVQNGFVFEKDGDNMKLIGIDKKTAVTNLVVPTTFSEYENDINVEPLNGELKIYENGEIVDGSINTITSFDFGSSYNNEKLKHATDSLKNLIGLKELTLPSDYADSLGHLFGTVPSSLDKVYISEGTGYSDKIIKANTGNATIIYPFNEVPIDFDFTMAKNLRFTNMTEIPDNMFNNCTGLVSVTFDKEITKVGSHAFHGCSALTTFNATVTGEIDSYAFYNCTSIRNIVLNSVTKIGRDAFKNSNVVTTDNTTGLEIVSGWIVGVEQSDKPSGVIELSSYGTIYGIADYAFINCSEIEEIDISATNIQYINKTMFVGCTLTVFGKVVEVDQTDIPGVTITINVQDASTFVVS